MTEKILIVDDDVDSLKLIGLMLQRQGYEIAAANSGTQALAKANSDSPDLIILDIMMPDMDGYEVCKRLRLNASTQDIPIIMFTAKTLVDDKVAGFEAGADDYLTKPTHPAELASRVKAVLVRTASKSGEVNEQGKLIAVLGVRGGVGTTTTAAHLATILSKKESIILADFRLGQGNLGNSLGIINPTGLANLASRPPNEINERTVSGEVISNPAGMRLLLSSMRPQEAQLTLSPEVTGAIVQNLRKMANLVILDLGVGLTPANQQVLRDANQVVLIADTQRVSLTMAQSILDSLGKMGVGPARISPVLINRAPSSLQISWQQAEQILERDVQALISPAPELAFQASEAGRPMISIQPGAVVSNQYSKFAEKLAVHLQIGDND
ncbi:response regulator [Chloroflexota bacterium]